jgi:segregation and condensation protein A
LKNELLVKLKSFEGPLDLLLYLIRKNEIDIYDIPIAQITEEYLETLNTMQEMNLEIAGEFLVMSSTLVFIKSRMLLPVYKSENDIANDANNLAMDPREELVKLLVEYQKFQDVGKNLNELNILGRDVFSHPKVLEENNEPTVLENPGLFNLISAYQKILVKYSKEVKTHNVDKPGKNLQEKLTELAELYPDGFLNKALDELLDFPLTKNEIVVSFLAILELSKLGFLKIIQIDTYSDILLTTIKPLSMLNLGLIDKESLKYENKNIGGSI